MHTDECACKVINTTCFLHYQSTLTLVLTLKLTLPATGMKDGPLGQQDTKAVWQPWQCHQAAWVSVASRLTTTQC